MARKYRAISLGDDTLREEGMFVCFFSFFSPCDWIVAVGWKSDGPYVFLDLNCLFRRPISNLASDDI